MPNTPRILPLAVLALLAAAPLQAADDAPLVHPLGTRHRFVQPPGSPYPAAGCIDHRALMFIVNEIEGEDPGAARLLVERDCRPLVPGADYIRCGPGGWAYPAKGKRISYASYCRVGAPDTGLYALDQQMAAVGANESTAP